MRSLPFEYAVRNLLRSPLRLLLIVAGSTLVVLLVLAASAFVVGMQQSLRVTGSDDNVMELTFTPGLRAVPSADHPPPSVQVR